MGQGFPVRVLCLFLAGFFAILFSATFRAKELRRGTPARGSTEFRAEPSQERLARGRYIAEGVAHCFGCHSESNFKNGHGQPRPGMKGAGQVITGEAFDGVAFPEGLVCPNITPDKETGAGTWTDAQFERAIRHGIGHDGRELSDYMPYAFFRSMTDEDVASVIVYVRLHPPGFRCGVRCWGNPARL